MAMLWPRGNTSEADGRRSLAARPEAARNQEVGRTPMQQQHGRHPADRTGSGPAAADAAPGGPRRPVALFVVAAGGGVQKVQVVLANALVGRGFDVDCVMPEAAGP